MMDVEKRMRAFGIAEAARKAADVSPDTYKCSRGSKPPGWQFRYVVLPEETPWWQIESQAVRNETRHIQWTRAFRRAKPSLGKESQRRFYKTPRGKATHAKHNAQRRELSTDPALYAARVRQLHEQLEPCAYPRCGNPLYKTTHEVDHIIALCLGGIDEWSNYQPLCRKCHILKSVEDRRKIAVLREMIEDWDEYTEQAEKYI